MFGEGWRFQKANNLRRDAEQWLWESGIISLSSHNGFLSYKRTESWETSSRQSLPQISELVSFSYKCTKCDLGPVETEDWMLVLSSHSGIWSMIKEASISAPVTSSLLPMHPFLLSPLFLNHSLLFYIPLTLAPRYLIKTAELYEIQVLVRL